MLFVWTFAGIASSAHAIDTMYPDDPNRQLKEGIEDAYGMYILLPSRRNVKEKIEINDENVDLWARLLDWQRRHDAPVTRPLAKVVKRGKWRRRP